MRGSPVMAWMVANWCLSSVILVQFAPTSSDRKTACTSLTVPTRNTAGGSESPLPLPKPIFSALLTFESFLKVAPESVVRHKPQTSHVVAPPLPWLPPVNQTSPSWEKTALILPVLGKFAAEDAVKVAPPSVLVQNLPPPKP